ncbi:MAG: glycosyltransferase family 2 protein [Spirochaetota bacterium]
MSFDCSVIVPVHNKEPVVRRCLESVAEQTRTPAEVIVVDDASTDGSTLIAREYCERYGWLLLERSVPGAGGYAARNAGVRASNCEWLAFLDADDEWFPEHLATVERLTRFDYSMAATNWINSTGKGWKVNDFADRFSGRDAFGLSANRFLRIQDRGLNPVHTNTVLVRKALFEQVGGFPEHCRRGGDVATWMRLVVQAGGLAVSPATTAVYHREASGIVRTVPAETSGNCVHRAVCDFLVDPPRNVSVYRLKRFSNIHLRFAIRKRLFTGKLRPRDLRAWFVGVAPLEALRYYLLSATRGRNQRVLFIASNMVGDLFRSVLCRA